MNSDTGFLYGVYVFLVLTKDECMTHVFVNRSPRKPNFPTPRSRPRCDSAKFLLSPPSRPPPTGPEPCPQQRHSSAVLDHVVGAVLGRGDRSPGAVDAVLQQPLLTAGRGHGELCPGPVPCQSGSFALSGEPLPLPSLFLCMCVCTYMYISVYMYFFLCVYVHVIMNLCM